jgi:hypothetical protein
MFRLKDNYQQYMEVIARLSALKSARDKVLKFINEHPVDGNILVDLMRWLKE